MQLPQTVEVKEIRVLTSKQIAEEYGTTPGVIKKNFSNNRERFVEGKHYISLTGDELRAFKNQVNNVHLVANRTSHLYLWTEKGALLSLLQQRIFRQPATGQRKAPAGSLAFAGAEYTG